MSSFALSVDFFSSSMSLEQLVEITGLRPTPESYTLGEIRFKKQGPRRASALRIFSTAPMNASLEEHFASLSGLMAAYQPQRIQAKDIRACFCVAHFQEGLFGELLLPDEAVDWARSKGFSIELCSYPGGPDQPSSEP